MVTRNGLGARGIDRIKRVGASTTVGYPIYDGHGNMVATLCKSGSSYSLGDQRSYDAWGVIRSGNTTGDPKGRYCANLGHVDDDESGLTYMRARYFESASGRFISEDSSMQGSNFFQYCGNNPVSRIDHNGNSWEDIGLNLFTLGRAMMAIGFLQFAAGLKVFLSGIAKIQLGQSMAESELGLYLAGMQIIAGAALATYGIANMAGGVNLFVRGLYVTQAGKYLMA